MAAAGPNAAADMKSLRSFRELFSGRFSDEEASLLLTKFNGDLAATLDFVLTNEPSVVRREIEAEGGSWTTVVGKIDRLRTREMSIVFTRALTKQIDTSARMFACRPCDSVWWRRTPTRKNVSKCRRCKKRYDALPRDREWGLAEFQCPNCSVQFKGFCAMWQTSPCYHCGLYVPPFAILPPTNQRPRKTNNQHCCSAPDCAGAVAALMGGRGGGRGGRGRGLAPGYHPTGRVIVLADGTELPDSCVHPKSLQFFGKPMVVVPAAPHDSTGSTIDTFLPQGDLLLSSERIPLSTIEEDD